MRGVYTEEKIVLPENSPRIPWVLHELHDSAIGGHSGFCKTYEIKGCWFGVLGWDEKSNP